jgi:hypothetical protein
MGLNTDSPGCPFGGPRENDIERELLLYLQLEQAIYDDIHHFIGVVDVDNRVQTDPLWVISRRHRKRGRWPSLPDHIL